MNADVFADIQGQEQVCGYLSRVLGSGRVTHAYLLAGADMDQLRSIARRFAAALVSGDDPGELEVALRGTHPDLHEVEPASSTGYLVEQAREIVHDAGMAPIRAPRKVYVFARAETLQNAPANALLKTLEEPSADVVCILLAASEDAVLETLRSRCEVLACRREDAGQPADELVFSLMADIARGADNRALLAGARRLVEASGAGLEELEARQAAELEGAEDYLSRGAVKEIETRHKREASLQQRAALLELLAAARSWLRDCLLVSQGAPELVAHAHVAAQTMQASTAADAADVLAALAAVETCVERISYNVTPQLAIEAMLMDIREALCRQ